MPENLKEGDRQRWFERISGLLRIPPVAGKSFSVIGASARAGSNDHFIRTRGIFLSESPAVISGICERLKPEDIDYFEENSSADIQRVLESWGQNTPKNAVHALRAPVNRIRGIAAILEHELTLSNEHKELLNYLKASSEKLSKLTLHITRKPYASAQTLSTVADVISDAVKTADDYTSGPIRIEVDGNQSGLLQQTALCLFNLAVNILTAMPMPDRVRIRQLDDQVVAIDFTTPEGQQDQLHDDVGATEGSLELFREVEDALVIRRIDDAGRLWHRIVLPASAMVPIN